MNKFEKICIVILCVIVAFSFLTFLSIQNIANITKDFHSLRNVEIQGKFNNTFTYYKGKAYYDEILAFGNHARVFSVFHRNDSTNQLEEYATQMIFGEGFNIWISD